MIGFCASPLHTLRKKSGGTATPGCAPNIGAANSAQARVSLCDNSDFRQGMASALPQAEAKVHLSRAPIHEMARSDPPSATEISP
jgi:hypothetical protein